MTSTLSHSEIRVPHSAIGKLRLFAADIKISHTLFAMPFAILSAFLAAGGVPHAGVLLLILGCMVTARTVAMAANRLLDAKIDAINPRTARRAIPSGALSFRFYATMLIVCATAFVLFTGGFWLEYNNPWPLILSLPVLAYISCYPLLKRFTRLCHYYLGGALALAPVCAWIAVRGDIAIPPLIIAAAVLTWTAGFDIIYACQDYESDRATGTFSIPAKIGIGRALWVARITHLIAWGLLFFLVTTSPLLGSLYLVGVALAAILLIIEHSLVRPTDLSKVNLAFFTINGIFSLLLGTLGVIDVLI
jgi:4-hydroxybenzoate polyprenyltransferase